MNDLVHNENEQVKLRKWRKVNNNEKKRLIYLQVKAIRNFEISGIMGFWYIVQYYASSEEAAEYSCMKCNFSMNTENVQVLHSSNSIFR